MLNDSFRRTAVLVSLIAVLASPCASAVGPGSGSVQPVQVESASLDLLDIALSFFRIGGSRTPYLKEGCKIDPDGRCYTAVAQPPHTKEGCKIDPNGLCYTAVAQPPHTRTGCKIDPNSFCLP